MVRCRLALISSFAAAGLALLAPDSGASAQQPPSSFEMTDHNADGSIDRNEYALRMVDVFFLDDRNKDGVLEIEELQAIEVVDPKAFAAADSNGDGVLSLEEFVTYRARDFDQADADHNGSLSSDEVSAYGPPPAK
ncbi:MAG: EF-hand domain-containing protein [Rhodospirillales bacterium]|nr:EF-hand domain-containing protein [Rhodospirillales bacterium]